MTVDGSTPSSGPPGGPLGSAPVASSGGAVGSTSLLAGAVGGPLTGAEKNCAT